MNRILITTLAGVFFLTMAPTLCAQTAPDANTPDWQSMSAADLLWAAKNLAGTDPAVVTARQSLAGNVAARFLADPVVTRTLSLSQWREFAKALSAGLTAEQRGQWIGKIRAAYVQDATGLAFLKQYGDIENLIGALGILGDKQDDVDGIAATFVKGTTLWQSWPPGDVANLATRIAALGESGTAARQTIISMVTSKYVSAGSGKSLTLGQWESFSGTLAPGLSAEAKAQWAAIIIQAYAGSGETAISLTVRDAEQLTSILERLDAKDLAAGLMARLAGDSAAVQPMSFDKLSWMLDGLTGDTPAIKAARKNIADVVTTKFLADPAATRSVSCGQWDNLTNCLSAGMTAERRSQWIAQLRAVYVQDPVGMASLKKHGDLVHLIYALNNLGDKQDDLKGVAATFVKSTTLWQSWSSEEVADLATKVGAPGELGATARQSLIALVASKYVSAGSGKSLTLGEWESFSWSLAPGLSAEAKAQWAAIIIQAYAGSGETAGALTARDVEMLVGALRSLAAEDLAVSAVAKLVNDSTAWQSWNLDSQQARLIGTLTAPDKRESTKAARLKILDRITATCMATAEDAKKVPLSQWADLIMGLYDVMPAETRTLWGERLRGIFDIAALSGQADDAEQRNALLSAIAILDDKMKTGLALSWLKNRTLWQGATIEALANLAVAAYRGNSEETLPILDDLEKHFRVRDITRPVTWAEGMAIRDAWEKTGNMDRAQEWVMTSYWVALGSETARRKADLDTLLFVSRAISDTGMSGRDRPYPPYAAALALVAAKGGITARLWRHYALLAEPLGAAETRQIARDALLDAQGNPRLGLAKVLACAYKKWDGLDEWRAYVDQQVSAAPANSDVKALWELVLGYTKSVTPDEPDVLQVRPGVTAALASAATDQVRVIAWRELADMYLSINRPGVAAEMIESVKGQFTGDSLATIGSMQKELQAAEAARLKPAAP